MARNKRKHRRTRGVEGQEQDEGEDGSRKRNCGQERGQSLPVGKQRLTEEQEDRLGRWSSSIQWIIKIAQGRGSNACLAIQSIDDVQSGQGLVKMAMRTFDGQQVTTVFRGGWVEGVASVLSSLSNGYGILVSGMGATIASSGSEVVFDTGKLIAEVHGLQSGQSHGWLEVVDGKVYSMPIVSERQQQQEVQAGQTEAKQGSPCESTTAEDLQGKLAAGQDLHQARFDSVFQTPARTTEAHRDSTSSTPAWLRTPADCGHTMPVSSSSGVESSPSVAAKTAAGLAAEPRMLGTRIYTPIARLPRSDGKTYNVIALVTTDHASRQALGGTRDWKVTVGLTDVEQSKDGPSVNVSFNLFSRQAEGIPRCKPGSILLLRGIRVKEFNGMPQGAGYSGDFEWALMDTSDSEGAKTYTSCDGFAISPAERKELHRLFDGYRKRQGRNGHAVQATRRKRPLITLGAIEPEVFFDTTVEILKVWDRSHPPEIYVTDHTSHPLFYAANDVHLGALSREELQGQQEECNDAGNGRVLSISLWDDQEEAIRLVRVGMVVRLENVRAKMQPNRYLCGTMGGGGGGSREEKLKVIVVNDKGVIGEIQKRKEEYLEGVAVKRAERAEEDGRGNAENLSGGSGQSSATDSDSRPLSISTAPPPGQQALSPIVNGSSQRSQQSNSGKSEQRREEVEEGKEVPIRLDDCLASYSITPLEQINNLPAEQLIPGKVFLCRGRVCDMQPGSVDEMVEAVCGLCKSKLPIQHAFCAKCSEEDGKDLNYHFNFALLVEQTDQEHAASRFSQDDDDDEEGSERVKLIVEARGEGARLFLNGFHPADVRNRTSTMARLNQRLLPLLGDKMVHGDGCDVQQTPRPFEFAIRAHAVRQANGQLRKRYLLTHTCLVKEGGEH